MAVHARVRWKRFPRDPAADALVRAAEIKLRFCLGWIGCVKSAPIQVVEGADDVPVPVVDRREERQPHGRRRDGVRSEVPFVERL